MTNITAKLHITSPSWKESIGTQQIPLTKGQ